MNLNDMTLDVLGTIYGFLKYKDKLNIILVSKLITDELRPVRSFRLNLESSIKYCLDELFRKEVKRIISPSNYLSLIITKDIYMAHIFVLININEVYVTFIGYYFNYYSRC